MGYVSLFLSTYGGKDKVENTKVFELVCKDLLQLYEKKNADYGDSFYETYSTFGLTTTCIRLHDKLKRLESLSKKDGNGEVKDESVDDTLRDIANYAIMTLIARSQKES